MFDIHAGNGLLETGKAAVVFDGVVCCAISLFSHSLLLVFYQALISCFEMLLTALPGLLIFWDCIQIFHGLVITGEFVKSCDEAGCEAASVILLAPFQEAVNFAFLNLQI